MERIFYKIILLFITLWVLGLLLFRSIFVKSKLFICSESLNATGRDRTYIVVTSFISKINRIIEA